MLVLAGFRWQAERREVQIATVAAPTTGRFVHAADVQMFIQEMGPATGPAVLFVHGTGAWSETWRESMAALAQAGSHTIAIDLPPFGYSGKPFNKRYGRQDQAARIIGVLDALKIPRATLVGHSFGGAVRRWKPLSWHPSGCVRWCWSMWRLIWRQPILSRSHLSACRNKCSWCVHCVMQSWPPS
ncbi:alpha/beta fold hydrolase [Undibacterium arcticum]